MSEKLLYARRCAELLNREVNGETILLNLSRYAYYGMNETGTAVWKSLEHTASIRTLSGCLCAEFAVDEARATRDISLFLAELEGEGLIEAGSGPAAVTDTPVPCAAAALRAYVPPQLEMGQLRNAACTESGVGSDGVPMVGGCQPTYYS